MIYDYSLQVDSVVNGGPDYNSAFENLTWRPKANDFTSFRQANGDFTFPLLHTCSQIRTEASLHIFKLNIFMFHPSIYETPQSEHIGSIHHIWVLGNVEKERLTYPGFDLRKLSKDLALIRTLPKLETAYVSFAGRADCEIGDCILHTYDSTFADCLEILCQDRLAWEDIESAARGMFEGRKRRKVRRVLQLMNQDQAMRFQNYDCSGDGRIRLMALQDAYGGEVMYGDRPWMESFPEKVL